MRIPRNVSGQELCKKLGPLGYSITRQVGSHIRLTTEQKGAHHVTIPNHDPIRIGTLSAILSEVASHFEISKEELAKILWG